MQSGGIHVAVHINAIKKLLEKWETRQLQGYVPCKKRNFTGLNDRAVCGEVIASSGVTIGTGVDLGQQDAAGMLQMGVPPALVRRFTPYFTKRREVACAALTAFPLHISEEEREVLDEAMLRDYVQRAERQYDNDSLGLFRELPAQAQAVVVSLVYHLGSGRTRYPVTWRHLCDEDWQAAAHELKTGFTKFANRRADEGRLLETLR